jgi:CRP-like cAMP-binding protein
MNTGRPMTQSEHPQAYELFREAISTLAETPEEMIRDLYSICTPSHYDKGQYFIMAGETPEDIGVNLNGVFRLYYFDEDGNDYTKGFSTPGKFVVSYSALTQNRPSFFSIEALVDSDILRFRFQRWLVLASRDIRWYKLMFKLIESVYLMKEMREKSFLLDSATDRYLAFRKEYPALESVVKLNHIASFIGIRPESLSRIRRRLHQGRP